MTGKCYNAAELLANSVDKELISRVAILAVGDRGEWEHHGDPLPKGGIAFVDFHEVTETMLEHLRPSTVFSPVLARRFDCIELALLLHGLGFRGAYRAMSKDLPRPEVIERQICPRLDFRIVVPNQ